MAKCYRERTECIQTYDLIYLMYCTKLSRIKKSEAQQVHQLKTSQGILTLVAM